MSVGASQETSRLFEALSHRYRRIVCYYIRGHETGSLATMAGLVTGWVEAGPGPDESVEYADLLALLHHVHLPRLDEAGLVSYDVTTRTITSEGFSEATESILDAAFESDVSGSAINVERVLAAAGTAEALAPDETVRKDVDDICQTGTTGENGDQ